MKKIHLALVGLLTSCHLLVAQNTDVQPVPQQATFGKSSIPMPQTYRLTGETEANPHAVEGLKALLAEGKPAKDGTLIRIGERGDKSVSRFARRIPAHEEGYYLSINPREIVIAGNDERGTYYALQTLSQLLKDGRLPEAEITDYPAVRYRGVVEGFYGTPWSHEARLSQLRFYGQNKMNTYIYGPKDDPYHSSPNWRLPYPETEAAQLKELVSVAHQNEVNFVWAIHPGLDIRWNDEDRDLLLAKFERMYDLGVRSFAVFFDDISGEGTNPVKQAELLNYIDAHFVRTKPDVTPLIMCPTEYNKSWSDPAKGYLTTLGEQLNPSIQIMWTGDRVISDITSEGIEWINERIRRPAYIWWNFPVSDYVRDHLLLGPAYGNDTSIANRMAGFVTNPMEHAEASKIAIYSVASYAWNPERYDSQKTWRDAIATLMPGERDALTFFAAHNSDLGENGHRYRRDESIDLQPAARRMAEGYLAGKGLPSSEDIALWQDTFERMAETADRLATSNENPALTAEMKPWLIQFKLLGETGSEVLALAQAYETGDRNRFGRKYRHVKALQQAMFEVDQTYNQNQYQPGVKTASKVIKPLIDQTFATVTRRYNERYQTNLDARTNYMPHHLTSDVEQLKNLPLQVKTNRVIVTPALEVIRWQAGGQMTIELDKPYPCESLILDLGKPDFASWMVLEVSSDGTNWERIQPEVNNRMITSLNNRPVKAMRLTNVQDQMQEVYLRQFILTLKK